MIDLCVLKNISKIIIFFSNQKNTSKLAKLHMRYLITKFMVQKRMPEKFCFDDLIRNFMVFIEPEAQPYKNSRNFQQLSIFL